jgi:hypothetical protein
MAKNYPYTVFGTRSRDHGRIPGYVLLNRDRPQWLFSALAAIERLIDRRPWRSRKLY